MVRSGIVALGCGAALASGGLLFVQLPSITGRPEVASGAAVERFQDMPSPKVSGESNGAFSIFVGLTLGLIVGMLSLAQPASAYWHTKTIPDGEPPAGDIPKEYVAPTIKWGFGISDPNPVFPPDEERKAWNKYMAKENQKPNNPSDLPQFYEKTLGIGIYDSLKIDLPYPRSGARLGDGPYGYAEPGPRPTLDEMYGDYLKRFKTAPGSIFGDDNPYWKTNWMTQSGVSPYTKKK